MTTRRLIVHPWEAAAVQAGASMLARPVDPQPEADVFGVQQLPGKPLFMWVSGDEGRPKTHHSTGKLFSSPFGQPGDVLELLEEFHLNDWQLEKGPLPDNPPPGTDAKDRYWLLYRADGPLHEQLDIPPQQCDGAHWRPASEMPSWAVRYRRTVKAVECVRFSELTSGRADCLGIGKSPEWNPKEVEGQPFEEKWWDDWHFWNHYPIIPFRRQWNADYPQFPAEGSPWLFIAELEAQS